MNRLLSIIVISFMALAVAHAQDDYSGFNEDGFDSQTNTFNPNARRDSTKEQKQEVPKGMYVWRVDPLFGDRIMTDKDTIQHLFMNTVFTSGMHGEYNNTGNLGSPRLNRIFIDRDHNRDGFVFTKPLDFFLCPVEQLRFTNTLSPMTQLNYYSCGDQTDGEDYLKVLFASNIGKKVGIGFKVNYMYGRGYYKSQATSLFDFTWWTSYIGDRYQAHLIFSTDHLKNTESGGIENDTYITHPEQFSDRYATSTSELTPNLTDNWNRNHTYHVFLTHRYSFGFSRKVPMTEEEIKAKKFAMQSQKEKEDREREEAGEVDSKGRVLEKLEGRPTDAKIMGDLPTDKAQTDSLSQRIQVESEAAADSLLTEKKKVTEDTAWVKDEYVPVTSFIHTLSFDHYDHSYIAYATPSNFYTNAFPYTFANDSLEDNTKHYAIRNTLALALLEGFNKYMKSGLKAYITSDIRHYELPDTVSLLSKYNENNIRVGAQLSTTQGRYFHYNVTGEFGILGKDLGDIKIDGTADVRIPLFRDTVRLDINGFFHRQTPDFYMRHYHSSHYWWDNDDLNKQTHTHIGGSLSYPKTKTSVRVGIDNIQDYVYLGMSYDGSNVLHTNNTAHVNQTSKNISLFTLELSQNFKAGPLCWENTITYQKSTQQEILPVPALNVWTNLYLDFKIAKVLKCHLGADATYFTRYYAPEYCPGLMQYAVQENSDVRTQIGNYPFVDVYANFVLKGCRFFVMYSHVTAGSFNKEYFTVAHYPMNEGVFRIGISWNFNN